MRVKITLIFSPGRNSPVKLKLGLPTFNKANCVQKYRSLGAELIDKQICAGGAFAEDACRGDSGGPLMKRRPEGIYLNNVPLERRLITSMKTRKCMNVYHTFFIHEIDTKGRKGIKNRY